MLVRLVGVVFLLAGLGFGLGGPYLLGQRARMVETAAELGAESLIDELVVAHGRIEPSLQAQGGPLVLGVVQEEREDADGNTSWKTQRSFGSPARMETATGLEVLVSVPDAHPQGSYRTEKLGAGSRKLGFSGGDEWLVVGRVLQLRPYELEAVEHFGGDRAGYAAHMTVFTWGARLVGLVFLGFGIVMVRIQMAKN